MTTSPLSALPLDVMMWREWLLAAGNGGYASSTVCGLNTRKYHGLLVAAMSPPVRRMVLLSRVEETVTCDGRSAELSCNEYAGNVIHPQGHLCLRSFEQYPHPRWTYEAAGCLLVREIRLVPRRNTVVLTYTLLDAPGPADLELRPLFALRGIHELAYQWNGQLDAEQPVPGLLRIPATARSPEAFFAHDGRFEPAGCWYYNTVYRREIERGYQGLEDLWMPGPVRWTLRPGQQAHFVCSAEPVEFAAAVREAHRPADFVRPAHLGSREDVRLDALLKAAAAFVVCQPDGTPAIVSGYPWAAPSARDAMIALPGLLLVPGRLDEARRLLAHFAGTLREGLMPSELAEDGSGYRYSACDTSLWFIDALWHYLRYTGDDEFIGDHMLPVAWRIIDDCRAGTDLGVCVDAEGLLKTCAPGVPTTWMDARLGDWLITPRQGRPVCLNALWYNALRIVSELSQRYGHDDRCAEMLTHAARAKHSFNRRFWNESAQCCYDVVEDRGSDPSVRPNQLLSISLPFAVLDLSRHAAVMRAVRAQLLTPVGLRTLAPDDPAYRGAYCGPVNIRDRAYHQGSAFPWLLGPLVSALIRLNGRSYSSRQDAARLLEGVFEHMTGPGMGQICELFDGDAPHRRGGLPASARSVAEVLRCYAEDILELCPSEPLPPRCRGVAGAAPERRQADARG